ncbi:hypothetical protein D3C80_1876330 [compost metagenome]
MPMKGVMPMPPAMRTPARAGFLCRPIEPNGPSSVSCAPRGKASKAFLKALPRMRVAMTSSSWKGALTMENACRASCAWAAGSASSTTSMAWPGLNSKPGGRSK